MDNSTANPTPPPRLFTITGMSCAVRRTWMPSDHGAGAAYVWSTTVLFQMTRAQLLGGTPAALR